MELAEALSLWADLRKRIARISVRLKFDAKVQEGDTPEEELKALLIVLI